jgi:SAM-dependent methyltransferase
VAEPAGEWWTSYFDEVFLRIYRPILSAERTAAELDAVRELLPRPGCQRILDVGCGWGRHSIALAADGYDVTGVDLSEFLLGVAKREAAETRVTVRWVRGDMRALEFDREFDAAISLFSSLGYFGGDEGDEKALRGIHRALKPGGRLLIDTMHRDLVARQFAERDWWENPAGDRILVEREFDPIEGVSHDLLRWQAKDGSEGEKMHHVRVRAASEWKALLDRCGFTATDWFGGWDLEPFDHTSGRLLVLCRAD